jgi:uncharacterized protein
MVRYTSIISSIILILFTSGCYVDQQEQEIRQTLAQPVFASLEEQQAYVDSINAIRYHKDEWMAEGPDSPLKKDEREDFAGLHYFPIDTDLIFRAKLQKYQIPEQISIGTTTGQEREAIIYGYFEFSIDDQQARLYAYKFTAHKGTELEEYLFIPFKDATSGNETYGGGRYMDLTEETPGVVLVDFNDAYNPYCVYNDVYSCPIPPRENHLSVAIRAGEKDYLH